MIPSLRLIIYFAIGIVLWAGAAVLPGLLVAAALYDLVLVFIAVMDLVLSARPRDFEIERVVPAKMNLGVPNVVTLHARNRTRHTVRLTLRDEPPLTWPVTVAKSAEGESEVKAHGPRGPLALPHLARVALTVEPAGAGETSYTVTPTRRGDFHFGALSARYLTSLGLWHRQFRRAADATVRVYPDTTEVRRYELRLREGRLRDMGLHITRLRGRGTEFESLRDYSTDDEFKDVNWKASARSGKLISTNYEIERDQTIVIALDCGRMMTALAQFRRREEESGRKEESENGRMSAPTLPLSSSPVPLSKLDCAINATVLLAHVSASMGDAVGLLLFADAVTAFVPPRKGRGQTGAIIEALYAAQPSLVEPDYPAAYEYLMARKIRRALVVTFTDLIDPFASRELLQASAALRRHHNALCVTINNHDVMDLAGIMPQHSEELYQKAMAQRMLAQRASALEGLRQRGVGILDVPAEQLTVATVNRYLDLKSRAAF